MGYLLPDNIVFQLLDEVLERLPYDGERRGGSLRVDVGGGKVEIYINQKHEGYNSTNVISLAMCASGINKRRFLKLHFAWRHAGFMRRSAVRYHELDHAKILSKVAGLDDLLESNGKEAK